MKDRNGVEITVGAKAVAIGSEPDETGVNGRIGVIRNIGGEKAMVGNAGEFQWGAWCGANDVVILR